MRASARAAVASAGTRTVVSAGVAPVVTRVSAASELSPVQQRGFASSGVTAASPSPSSADVPSGRQPRRLTLEGGRRPRVFCTRALPQEAYDALKGTVDLEVWPHYDAPSRDALLENIAQCDGLITLLTDKIDSAVLDSAPNLQIICQYAVGFNNIDLSSCSKRGIRVTNTPGVLTDTTAETALALMFACGRRAVEADRYVRDGEWKTAWHPLMLLGTDIHRSTVGIVGAGRIGAKVARVCKAIGARVIYYSKNSKPELEADGTAEPVQSLDALCEQSDIISLHCALTPETHHLFNADQLAKCKPTAILINTARGQVVDQAALAQALKTKRLAAAGLDVFDIEPLPLDDPLFQCENAILFPHLGSASTGTRAAMAKMVGENMASFWLGRPLGQLVNAEVEQ